MYLWGINTGVCLCTTVLVILHVLMEVGQPELPVLMPSSPDSSSGTDNDEDVWPSGW